MKTLPLLLGLIGGCLLWEMAAITGLASDLLSGRIKASGIVTSFYSGRERTPSVVVKVDRLYTDYERKGFFRIGVLPLGVLEGFTLDVRHSDSVTNALAKMQHWIGAPAGKRLEFRRVTLRSDTGHPCRLESPRARLVPGGRWELFGPVQFSSGTNTITAPHALLQITGPQTGELILATDPPCTNYWFTRIAPTNPNQKETP